jgi:hypothetical protein
MLPLYLLMVTYGKPLYALYVIENFLEARKPETKTKFIVVENSLEPELENVFNFSKHPDIIYYHFQSRNKARAINFAIREYVREEDALILAIDNDIKFKKEYLIKYYRAALEYGKKYYFGTSFIVKIPEHVDKNLKPFLQGSAKGKSDASFRKMKNLMFMGFSYGFFKSQWEVVGGLDERFSPGSLHGLAAEESVFQKKLRHAGFLPTLVERNSVEHIPGPEAYKETCVKKRQANNGFTHGFQDIIASSWGDFTYTKKLFFFLRKTLITYFNNENRLLHKMTAAYTKGYCKAIFLFLKIKNKKSFLRF